MKKIITLSVTSLLLSATVLSAATTTPPVSEIVFGPQSVQLLPQDVFLPPGFDDKNNIQVIVSGYLPNTCFKTGTAAAQVDEKEKKIYITNTAYSYGGAWCAEILIPYVHTVNVGLLAAGQYEVLVQDKKEQSHSKGILNVAVSVPKTYSPDDYLYAPVQDVYLDNPAAVQPNLVIRGSFPSTCMKMDRVEVLYRTPQIIEVLPIASFESNSTCKNVATSFETQVKLKSRWTGSTLIYVRSLNGQSIAKVVEL